MSQLHFNQEAQALLDEVLARCGIEMEQVSAAGYERALDFAITGIEEIYDHGFDAGLEAGRGGE